MRSRRESGIAAVTALSFLVVIGILIGTVLILAASNRRQASNLLRTTQAQYVAESGIERVVNDYYYTPIASIAAPNPRTLQRYRDNLKNALALDAGATAVVTGSIPYGSGQATYSATVKRVDSLPGPSTPGFLGSSSGSTTNLQVTSMGTLPDGTKRVITQTLFVANDLFNGFDYALLSNNVNCIFCHAKVTSMQDAYAAPGATPLKKVRVATLENLEIRTGSADTFTGGTIYSRGKFQCDAAGGATGCTGKDVTTPSAVDVKTYDVNGNNVGTTKVSLANDQNCATQTCAAGKNFYQNYPAAQGIDGDVPSGFPPPIPDLNGDRQIQDDEWQKAIADDTGGTMGGGSIHSVALGTKLTTPGQPSLATTVSSSDSANGVNGNLIVSAGPSDPAINISGTVYVNGDVVISGRVSGTGKIIARGNIYVVGDLQYDCTLTQGKSACDYSQTDKLPQLGLVAGGNVNIGDYMTQRTHYCPGDSNCTTQLTALGTNDTAILSDENIIEPNYGSSANLSKSVRMNQGDGTIKTVSTLKLKNASPGFVAGEVATFNRREYDKWKASQTNGTAYQPRFYKLHETDTKPFYYTGSGEKPDSYNEVTDLPSDALTAANGAIVTVSPKGGWISENQLKEFWIDNIENTNPPRPTLSSLTNDPLGLKQNYKKPLQIDGLMYSTNATFALARAQSQIQGSTIINGALVSADTGILSSGPRWQNDQYVRNNQINPGLSLHYDARLQNLLNLKSALTLARSDFQFRSDGETAGN